MKKKVIAIVLGLMMFTTGAIAAPLLSLPWKADLDHYFNQKAEEGQQEQDYQRNNLKQYVELKKKEIDFYFNNPGFEEKKKEIDQYVEDMMNEYEATH